MKSDFLSKIFKKFGQKCLKPKSKIRLHFLTGNLVLSNSYKKNHGKILKNVGALAF